MDEVVHAEIQGEALAALKTLHNHIIQASRKRARSGDPREVRDLKTLEQMSLGEFVSYTLRATAAHFEEKGW